MDDSVSGVRRPDTTSSPCASNSMSMTDWLFTSADIQAVHPDALTPWKAENLWRLYLATANYLDRSVDDERVGARVGKELVLRVTAFLPGRKAEVEAFLQGSKAVTRSTSS